MRSLLVGLMLLASVPALAMSEAERRSLIQLAGQLTSEENRPEWQRQQRVEPVREEPQHGRCGPYPMHWNPPSNCRVLCISGKWDSVCD